MTDARDTDRLDRMDHGIASIQAAIATLTADVGQLVKIQSRQQDQIGELQRLDRDRRNTPWSTLMSLGGLLIIIGGLSLQPVRESVSSLEARLGRHEQLEDHAGSMSLHQRHIERIERVEREIGLHVSRIEDMIRRLGG